MLLCGIYPPTSGTATIMGFDLRKDMDQIRSLIGFCPQYDILFDDLNVAEHLKLIAMVHTIEWFKAFLEPIFLNRFSLHQIKGFPKEALQAEILRIATYIGLHKDLSKKSKNLSGGKYACYIIGFFQIIHHILSDNVI